MQLNRPVKKVPQYVDIVGLVLFLTLFVLGFQRRDRDSNPGCLAAQRFSRPPQSTTLPPLQNYFFKQYFPLKAVQRYNSFFISQTFPHKNIIWTTFSQPCNKACTANEFVSTNSHVRFYKQKRQFPLAETRVPIIRNCSSH